MWGAAGKSVSPNCDSFHWEQGWVAPSSARGSAADLPWVCWALPFGNREALGSWGQTQTSCSSLFFASSLKLPSISVPLISLARGKAEGKWWEERARSPNSAAEVGDKFAIACSKIWCQTFNGTSSHPGDHTSLFRAFLENILFFFCFYNSYGH